MSYYELQLLLKPATSFYPASRVLSSGGGGGGGGGGGAEATMDLMQNYSKLLTSRELGVQCSKHASVVRAPYIAVAIRV